MRKRAFRTMRIQISEDTYRFLSSELIKQKDLCNSFGVGTVEELLSLFLDSDWNSAEDILAYTYDDIDIYKDGIESMFNYIDMKRRIRDKTDPEDYLDKLIMDVDEIEEWAGYGLPDPYDDGRLRFFKGWFTAMDWILGSFLNPLSTEGESREE